MKILSYKTENFAGIKQRSYVFEEGINVLFGPNEAGKSSIIDGIFHTIFTPSKLHKISDKAFIEKYFNKASDTIDGNVRFEYDGQVYEIQKTWSKGSEGSEKLILHDGSLITKPNTIQEKIRAMFEFGPATYKALNFHSHGDFFDGLSQLRDGDIQNDLKGYLNRSLMVLDGVSLEILEEKIAREIEDLGSRWDIDGSRPMNSRGIDNPYVKGVGKVLKSYYHKERLKRDIRIARDKEEAFEDVGLRLKAKEDKLKQVKSEKDVLDSKSEDIRKRQVAESKLESIDRDLQDLKVAMKDLPSLEFMLEKNKEAYESNVKSKEDIDNKLLHIEKNKRYNLMKEDLESYEKLEMEYSGLSKDYKAYEPVNEGQLNQIKDLVNRNMLLEGQLSTEALEARLDLKDDKAKFRITDALGQELKGDLKSSYMKLEVEGILDFTVAVDGVDFQAIRDELGENKDKIKKILGEGQVKDLEDLTEKLIHKNQIKNNLDRLDFRKKDLLKGRDIEDIRQEQASLREYEDTYNEDELRQALAKLNTDIEESRMAYSKVEFQYSDLLARYGSADEIFKKTGTLSIERAKYEEGLKDLAVLPDEFSNTDEFFERKTKLDREFDLLNREYIDLNNEYNEKERDLSEVSVEEMSLILREAEASFERYSKKLDQVIEIQRIFEETKAEMNNNPLSQLEDRMDLYLSKITGGNIQVDKSRGDIGILGRKDEPLKDIHLSKGSKESVNLAFRLSLIDTVFAGKSFIALDDILNDLDGYRRKQAQALLKEFAKDNQLIFATCDSSIRDALAGNTIEVGEEN